MRLSATRSLYVSIGLGAAYGIALRVLMDVSGPDGESVLFRGLVSISFFVLVPLIIGFLTVFLAERGRNTSLKWAVFSPWIAIGCFLVASIVLLLEGSICVAIALPGFLALSSVGGVLAWWMIRARAPRTGALCAALIVPLLASPIEGLLPIPTHTDTVKSRIRIDAPLDVVWTEITDVEPIAQDELAFGLTRLMGMPRPIEAHMEPTESGLVRITRWDQGVRFRELVTASQEYEVLQWVFDFPPSAVPDGVLDDHVQIGGRYFELFTGGYSLELEPDGVVLLSLETTYGVSARPSWYARLWAAVVLADFERMILKLIRDRSEKRAG